MKVMQYSTNKYGEMMPYEIKEALYMSGTVTARPAEKREYSGFLGFGVAITGSSCYNLSLMKKSERRKLLENIYGKDGLGLSVSRLSVGSSDYSAELYTYDDVNDDALLEHFSIARDEEYIIPIIKEILEINPGLYLFASPWSPPGWMKTGGSACGGHMRDKYIECYADYFVKYIKAYGEHGIKIRAVTPQNEPETSQSGRMPACVWNPQTEAEFIGVLKKKLDENALDVEIWIHDHSFEYSDRVDWQLTEYPGLRKDIGGAAFHYYGGSIEQTAYLTDKFDGLSLHFTEGGPRLYDHYDNDWCKWGIMISKALNHDYRSFTGWNLMLDETGGPNIGPFFCGGLVTRNRDDGELSYSGQYKAFRHFSKYIDVDSQIIPIEFDKGGYSMFEYSADRKPLIGTLVENADGVSALMLINPNEAKTQIQFFYRGKWWYIELLPETLATVLFTGQED